MPLTVMAANVYKNNNSKRSCDRNTPDGLPRIDRWINNEDNYNIDYTDPWNLG